MNSSEFSFKIVYLSESFSLPSISWQEYTVCKYPCMQFSNDTWTNSHDEPKHFHSLQSFIACSISLLKFFQPFNMWKLKRKELRKSHWKPRLNYGDCSSLLSLQLHVLLVGQGFPAAVTSDKGFSLFLFHCLLCFSW